MAEPPEIARTSVAGSIPSQDTGIPQWNWATRVAFRFTCAYILLYIFPFWLSYFSWVSAWLGPYWKLRRAVVPWVGQHVFLLGYNVAQLNNGSEDTTWRYILCFCNLVLALAVTFIWSILDRRRKSYAQMLQWLRLLVRFFLAAQMFAYGLEKIFLLQMPRPPLGMQLDILGDFSPLSLLWTFIGSSPSFQIFSGAMEVLAGILLVMPRTPILGALLCAVDLSFVLALNMCYDVPVKLFSAHLWFFSIFLLTPELGRLADLFLLGGKVELTKPTAIFSQPWANRTLVIAQVMLGVCLFGSYLLDDIQLTIQLQNKSPLYGIWSVDEFIVDGQSQPLLLTDETLWRKIVFDDADYASVVIGNSGRRIYKAQFLPDKNILTLIGENPPETRFTFSIEPITSGRMTLNGEMNGRHVQIKLERFDEKKFILMNRGFRWINEYPFYQS